jgi:hypothetical protein
MLLLFALSITWSQAKSEKLGQSSF